MKKSKKTGKRIVSKSEYAANIGKKGIASSVGAVLLLMSTGCMLIVGLFIWIIARFPHAGIPIQLVLSMILIFGILIYGAVYIFQLAKREIMPILRMDVGVPLTRANSADLPAPDVLVRASEKPVQEQSSVLLRAAAGTPATPADQLLRSVTEEIAEANVLAVHTLKVSSDANG